MASRRERPSVTTGFPQSSHRVSAASGIVFVALLITSVLLYGFDFPTYDDSGATFAAFYADNATRIEVSVLVGAFAGLALIWFIGFMRWVFAGAEMAARGFARATDIGYAAAIAGVALAGATLAAQQAAVVGAGSVPPGVIRVMDLLGDYAFLIGGLLFSVWLLTSFFVIRVTKVLADWLAVVAIVGTVLGVVQATLLLAPQDDDGVLGLLGILFTLALLVWALGASIALVRRVEAIQRRAG